MTQLRFSAVVGQSQAKAALLMSATNPLLGGVLLRGDKGSAKTTLARGLAALLPGDAPFVELPLGATEERVVGSLDLAALLVEGQPRFRPGLLAAANGGVLYVDEINLLADHLVDTLLDVSVSGINRIERDGVSYVHPARFVLIASMNPEEGELRPQLLDRFGLSVDVQAIADVSLRVEVLRRQLDAERSPDGEQFFDPFVLEDGQLRQRILDAGQCRVEIPDEILHLASQLAVQVGAEGMRADLMLCRAAAATAALDQRSQVTADDVRSVAELVLGHRRRRRPFDEPGITQDELDHAWQQATAAVDDRPAADQDAAPDAGSGSAPDAASDADRHDDSGAARPVRLPDERRSSLQATAGRDGLADGTRGRVLRDAPYNATVDAGIDGRASAVALAARRNTLGDPLAPLAVDDLRTTTHEQRTGSLLLFVVDASASMGVEQRMSNTKAAILGLLGDAYRRRGRVALITFRGNDAEIVLRPTASIEIARARLVDLRTGGATPLAAGLDQATKIVGGVTGDSSLDCTVILVTDGRATAGGDHPMDAAHLSMQRLAMTGVRIVVLDTETGPVRLGLARALAEQVSATVIPLDIGDESQLERTIRSL